VPWVCAVGLDVVLCVVVVELSGVFWLGCCCWVCCVCIEIRLVLCSRCRCCQGLRIGFDLLMVFGGVWFVACCRCGIETHWCDSVCWLVWIVFVWRN